MTGFSLLHSSRTSGARDSNRARSESASFKLKILTQEGEKTCIFFLTKDFCSLSCLGFFVRGVFFLFFFFAKMSVVVLTSFKIFISSEWDKKVAGWTALAT